MSSTVRFTANKDTLLARFGGTDYGGGQDNHLPIGYYEAAAQLFRAAIDFPLNWSGVNKIVSATLSCRTTNGFHFSHANDPDIYVERITGGEFTENSGGDSGLSTATSDYGDVSATTSNRATWDVGGATNPPNDNTWYSKDVTDIIEDVAPASVLKRSGSPGGGLNFYGFRLRSTDETNNNNNVEFASIEGGHAATLLLVYDTGTAPSAPTGLSPSGTITDTTPSFSGLFSDVDPGDSMTRLEIDVSTDSTFATVTKWDLDTTNFGLAGSGWSKDYAGTTLSAGVTYYWRARVYDSVGLVSAWSATQSFTLAAGSSAIRSFRAGPPRIEIWTNSSSTKGPTTLAAIIEDAKFIGVSEYANEVGELFFTLPYNHIAVSTLTAPLERHYRVARFDAYTGTYKTVGRGIMEDYEHHGDEIVFRGSGYVGMLETTITPNSTTYSNEFLGTIINNQVTAAIAETNSRLAFTSVGTIETTSKTTTLLTSSEQRISLIRSAVSIAMATSSVRSIFGISRDSPYQWYFTENKGSENLSDLRLEYGGAVNGFLFTPGYSQFATRMRAIGLKVEGATILYSEQTYGSEAVVGLMARFQLFRNVINQAALDSLTLRAAREAGVPQKSVRLLLRANQLIPWGGWDLGDNIRVVVRRGAAATLDALYTIWGMEWTTEPNGRENLYLALGTKLTS